MPNIPPVDRAALEAAMDRFDQEFRGQGRWARWPTQANKFALVRDGKPYPVKFIISLATGASVSEFSGGREANSYVTRRGLTVAPISHDQAGNEE